MAGWNFSVSPCPDQSPSRRPIGTLTPQYAYLVLVFVSGGTAPHLSRRQVDRSYVPPMWQAVFRTRSRQRPQADQFLGCSRPFDASRPWCRCVMRRHSPQQHLGFWQLLGGALQMSGWAWRCPASGSPNRPPPCRQSPPPTSSNTKTFQIAQNLCAVPVSRPG